MAKYTSFLYLVLFPCLIVVGQTSKSLDSLWLVKNYLIELRNKLPLKESQNMRRDVEEVDSLASHGNIYRIIFQNQLEAVISENEKEVTRLLREYDFIFQSLILLKIDLKHDNFMYTESSLLEAQFLTQKIPALVDEIYFIGQLYEKK